MRGIVLKKYVDHIDAETLKQALVLEEKLPMPEVCSSDVLIKVIAISINPVDWKIVKGSLAIAIKSPPFVPGFDLAGVVQRVGANCKRIKVGDPVYAMAHFRSQGTFAEYVAIPERHVSLKPPSLTYAEAASIPLVGLTSYQGLAEIGGLQKHQKVLILAGSGGTGSFAIQLAKHIGADVIATTCSERNAEFVKDLGATVVIDYNKENWWEKLAGQDFDVIYDCVGGHNVWEQAQGVLRARGATFVTIAGDKPENKLNVPKLLAAGASMANRKFWSVFGYPRYSYITCDSSRGDQLAVFSNLIAHGALKPVVEKVYKLEEYEQFYLHSASGRVRGKICLAMRDEANSK